ncbi:MAG: eS25 family ribosomal protein [Candidatus Odinarchaeia archaeon]
MPKKIKVKAKVSSKKKSPVEKIEKNIREVEVKAEILENIKKEVPKMKVITPNQVATKYNIRLSVARDILGSLAEKGLIKQVGSNRRLKLYTKVAAE